MNFDILYNYSIFTFSPVPYCKIILNLTYINQNILCRYGFEMIIPAYLFILNISWNVKNRLLS